jgi:hypothetical protein
MKANPKASPVVLTKRLKQVDLSGRVRQMKRIKKYVRMVGMAKLRHGQPAQEAGIEMPRSLQKMDIHQHLKANTYVNRAHRLISTKSNLDQAFGRRLP